MRFFLAITLGLFLSLPSYGYDCTISSLERLLSSSDLDETPVLGSFNDSEKLTAKVTKEVKPLLKATQDAYALGNKLRYAQAKILELSRVKPQTVVIKNTIHDLELAHSALNRELIDLNNDFVTKMHALFKKDGIPSLVVKTVDETGAWRFFKTANREVAGREVLTLKLDFTATDSTHPGFNYYRRIKKVFGINEATVSLKLTGEASMKGAFLPNLSRIEMGPEGARNLLQHFINTTGKHESRHAMFAHWRVTGDESIFHTQFSASLDGNLLNEIQFYEGYMSAEELYTFSTDLQTMAQSLKGSVLTDLNKRNAILKEINDGTSGLLKVSQTQMDVTKKMIESLQETLAQPLTPPNVSLNVYPLGNYTLTFSDSLGRTTTASFVSESEKLLLSDFKAADKTLKESIEAQIVKDMSSAGVDTADLEKRVGLNLATPDEIRTILGLYAKYVDAPEFKALKDAKDIAIRPVIIAAKVRMEKLNRLATIQNREAKILEEMLKQPTGPSQIEAIKKQMFLVAKNVKERFKGFALNPK